MKLLTYSKIRLKYNRIRPLELLARQERNEIDGS